MTTFAPHPGLCCALISIVSIAAAQSNGLPKTQELPPVKALVINLPEDTQRREHSAELLNKINMDFEVVAAIRPNASLVGKVRNQGTQVVTL